MSDTAYRGIGMVHSGILGPIIPPFPDIIQFIAVGPVKIGSSAGQTVINVIAPTHNVGDLLLCHIASHKVPEHSTYVMTGWVLEQQSSGDGTNGCGALYSRIADGSVSDSTVNTSVNGSYVCIISAWRFCSVIDPVGCIVPSYGTTETDLNPTLQAPTKYAVNTSCMIVNGWSLGETLVSTLEAGTKLYEYSASDATITMRADQLRGDVGSRPANTATYNGNIAKGVGMTVILRPLVSNRPTVVYGAGGDGSFASTWIVPYPMGTIAGDTIYFLRSVPQGGGTLPAGWTLLTTVNEPTAPTWFIQLWKRDALADGSEPGTSINVINCVRNAGYMFSARGFTGTPVIATGSHVSNIVTMAGPVGPRKPSTLVINNWRLNILTLAEAPIPIMQDLSTPKRKADAHNGYTHGLFHRGAADEWDCNVLNVGAITVPAQTSAVIAILFCA